MAVYAVGDIHGCFREWITFKSKIENQDAEAEFILVGDILDKGPNSFEMLQWTMDKMKSGSKFQMVRGNHETEKLEWLKYVLNGSEDELWKNHAIARKMLSADGYEFFKICCEKNLQNQQLTEIMKWMEKLPLYVEKEVLTSMGMQKFIITHYKWQPKEIPSTQPEQQAGDNFAPRFKSLPEEVIVIHGHKPTTLEPCKSAGAIPGKIWKQGNDINIDCGLVYGVAKAKGLYGDLAALRLEDFKEFYYYNHVF